jgi:hypothetical protein
MSETKSDSRYAGELGKRHQDYSLRKTGCEKEEMKTMKREDGRTLSSSRTTPYDKSLLKLAVSKAPQTPSPALIPATSSLSSSRSSSNGQGINSPPTLSTKLQRAARSADVFATSLKQTHMAVSCFALPPSSYAPHSPLTALANTRNHVIAYFRRVGARLDIGHAEYTLRVRCDLCTGLLLRRPLDHLRRPIRSRSV